MSKKVFKYNDGTYYAWQGESTICSVTHKTKRISEAHDFSWFPEKQDTDIFDIVPRYDGGKLIKLLTHDEALEQLTAMTTAKNKLVKALQDIESPLRMAASELRQANLTGTPSYLEIHANNINSLIEELKCD
jgi:hypothetical protein